MSPELLGRLTLFVAVPLNVIVVVLLLQHSRRHPRLRVLRERFVTASAVLFTLIVFGLIFVNNDQVVPPINEDWTKIITRASMLVVGVVPAMYWLLLYLSGKKGDRSGKKGGSS